MRVIGATLCLLIAGAAAGCSSAVEPGDNPVTSAEPPSTLRPSDAGDDGPQGSPPPVADWTAPTPLSNRVDMSDEEKMGKRAAYLAVEAEAIGLEDPPKVELIRWITPEEWAPTLVECANDQGFPVGYTTDGGINSANIPGEQTPALQLAMHVCMAQYTVDPRYTEELNAEQRGIVYDYQTTYYVSCLKKLGIEVAKPPSREVFMATADGDGWMPQLGLPKALVSEANATCPVLPRSDVLYGS